MGTAEDSQKRVASERSVLARLVAGRAASSLQRSGSSPSQPRLVTSSGLNGAASRYCRLTRVKNGPRLRLTQTQTGVSRVTQTQTSVSCVTQIQTGVSCVTQTHNGVSRVTQTHTGVSSVTQTQTGVSSVTQTQTGVSRVRGDGDGGTTTTTPPPSVDRDVTSSTSRSRHRPGGGSDWTAGAEPDTQPWSDTGDVWMIQ